MPTAEDVGIQIPTLATEYKNNVEAKSKIEDMESYYIEESQDFPVNKTDLSDLGLDTSVPKLHELGGVMELARKLEVDVRKGIDGSPDDIKRRQLAFGSNVHPGKPPRTIWHYVGESMQDSLLQVLLLCGVASIAVSIPSEGVGEGLYDGSGIFLALVIIITVTSVSNHRQAQQFHLLNEEKSKVAIQVTRGGRRHSVPIQDLVVGDVVHLSVGDQVPADGVFIRGHSLSLDESSMTGESELVAKSSQQPFILAGCSVLDGYGDMLVVGVGMSTQWGQTLESLTEENDEETPLQIRLTKVATLMGQGGLVVGVALFVVLCARYMLTEVNFSAITSSDVSVLLDFFTVAVTVLVIAIPEGLPLAVALTLAFSVRKMMQDKSLVRHLAACELMGSSTTICSDKTGTLTMNQMTVTRSWVSGVSFQSADDLLKSLHPSVLNLLHGAIANNTTGSVFLHSDERVEISGSPTESAILDWGVQLGMSFAVTRSHYSVKDVEVFNSESKRMGVLVENQQTGATICYWKGAAEILLEKCDSWVDSATGAVQSMANKRREVRELIADMGHSALRIICLAYRNVPAGEPQKLLDANLTCLAILGIKDPCRPEVPESVSICQKAGIVVRMVTGDNLETAKAIARESGILTGDGVSMHGSEFRSLSPAGMAAIIPRLRVLARASPSDKLLLVQKLRQLDEVVAVTGDGTNDAPALHEADVGLAMGMCGTEVAKQSADIIILDDNFASIVKTVSWGRSVYRNIQKFLQFQITTTMVAIGLNFMSSIFAGSAPLSAVQMLWVDLIQDTFGALALASEPPTAALLREAPVGRHSSLISPSMWRNIAGQSLYQITTLLTLWFFGKEWLGLPGTPGAPSALSLSMEDAVGGSALGDTQLVTIVFNTFVFCQVFNEINSRMLDDWNVFEGLHRNQIFLAIIAIEVGCQVVMVNYLSDLSNTCPIGFWYWMLCLAIGALSVPWGMIVKLIPLPTPGSHKMVDGHVKEVV